MTLTMPLAPLAARQLKELHAGVSTRSHVWYRVFNEIPVLLMLFIVALVIHKPDNVLGFLQQMTLVLAVFVGLVMVVLRRLKPRQ